uniref:Uncharacterized protein n=1 Tax=Heterorhabditis bacteriophora TaxID=37862 RepID=A0A1I7X6M2_HETBA
MLSSAVASPLQQFNHFYCGKSYLKRLGKHFLDRPIGIEQRGHHGKGVVEIGNLRTCCTLREERSVNKV